MKFPEDGEYNRAAFTGVIIEIVKPEIRHKPMKVVVFDKNKRQAYWYRVAAYTDGEWVFGIPLLLGLDLTFTECVSASRTNPAAVMWNGIQIATLYNGYINVLDGFPGMLIPKDAPMLLPPPHLFKRKISLEG